MFIKFAPNPLPGFDHRPAKSASNSAEFEQALVSHGNFYKVCVRKKNFESLFAPNFGQLKEF